MYYLTFRTLEELQAVLPVHPDDQLAILRKQVEEEQSNVIRPEDVERIQYYLNKVRYIAIRLCF